MHRSIAGTSHLNHVTITGNTVNAAASSGLGRGTVVVLGQLNVRNSIIYGNGDSHDCYRRENVAGNFNLKQPQHLRQRELPDRRDHIGRRSAPGRQRERQPAYLRPGQAGSPAIDGADCITDVPVLATDQRGVSRPARD